MSLGKVNSSTVLQMRGEDGAVVFISSKTMYFANYILSRTPTYKINREVAWADSALESSELGGPQGSQFENHKSRLSLRFPSGTLIPSEVPGRIEEGITDLMLFMVYLAIYVTCRWNLRNSNMRWTSLWIRISCEQWFFGKRQNWDLNCFLTPNMVFLLLAKRYMEIWTELIISFTCIYKHMCILV